MGDVTVIGAGMAGLLAADTLQRGGHRVVVVDKGRGVGGRLATRRLGAARCDHGAQFFTVRNRRFSALNARWLAAGVTRAWCHGFGDAADGHPRYIGATGMTALAKELASGLDVRCGTLVEAIGRRDRWAIDVVTTPGGISVEGEAGTRATLHADAVICTSPVPQTLALLDHGGTVVDPAAGEALSRVRYSPVLAAMAVLDGPGAVPAPGGVQLAEGTFTWIGDNRAKGISPLPAITFHAGPGFSAQRYGDHGDEVLADLLDRGREWLGGDRVVDSALARWRFAQPTTLHDERMVVAVDGPSPLVCAGDAFGEARVEGAARSGWAAAEAVLDRLS